MENNTIRNGWHIDDALAHISDLKELVRRTEARASSAESSLAAMRQRAEEAERIVELAKNIVRTGQVEPDAGMDGNTLVPTYDFAILDGALSRYDAVLSSPPPPADASTMGGERGDFDDPNDPFELDD